MTGTWKWTRPGGSATGDDTGAAIRALEDTSLNSVDIDERAAQWKAQGWEPPAAGAAADGVATRSVGEDGRARVCSYGSERRII